MALLEQLIIIGAREKLSKLMKIYFRGEKVELAGFTPKQGTFFMLFLISSLRLLSPLFVNKFNRTNEKLIIVSLMKGTTMQK